MTQDKDIKAYIERWKDINLKQQEAQSSATLELRWQQLNSVFNLALGLGLVKHDPSEAGVYERWAKLREKMKSQKT